MSRVGGLAVEIPDALAVTGALAAMSLVRYRARRTGLSVKRAVDGLVWIIVGALFFGHTLDVLLYRSDDLATNWQLILPWKEASRESMSEAVMSNSSLSWATFLTMPRRWRASTSFGIIYNNTFYGLTGLSTGFRFTGRTTNVQVRNNLWAHNRTNQIPMASEHDFNALCDAIRPDSQEDLSKGEEEDPVQVMDDDPFEDASGLDFHLRTATDPGDALGSVHAEDPDGKKRGADGVWDRGPPSTRSDGQRRHRRSKSAMRGGRWPSRTANG